MTFLSGINPLAVLVAAAVYYVIGFLWYTRFFGETWRQETGVSDPTAKPPTGALIGQFISTLLFTLGIAIILNLRGSFGIAEGVLVSALVTVFFAIPINSGNLFFTGKKRLFLIDVSERALGSLVVGVILGVWR